MVYSFWQYKISTKTGLEPYQTEANKFQQFEDPTTVLVDLIRGNSISLASRLVELPSDATQQDVENEINKLLQTPEIPIEQQPAFLEVLKKYLHHGALLYIAERMLLHKAAIFSTPDRSLDIVPKGNALYFHEINYYRHCVPHTDGWVEEENIIQTQEPQYLAHTELLFKLFFDENNQPQIEVLNVLIDCQDNRVAQYFDDERSLIQKIIDFFKSLFGINALDATARIEEDSQQRSQLVFN